MTQFYVQKDNSEDLIPVEISAKQSDDRLGLELTVSAGNGDNIFRGSFHSAYSRPTKSDYKNPIPYIFKIMNHRQVVDCRQYLYVDGIVVRPISSFGMTQMSFTSGYRKFLKKETLFDAKKTFRLFCDVPSSSTKLQSPPIPHVFLIDPKKDEKGRLPKSELVVANNKLILSLKYVGVQERAVFEMPFSKPLTFEDYIRLAQGNFEKFMGPLFRLGNPISETLRMIVSGYWTSSDDPFVLSTYTSDPLIRLTQMTGYLGGISSSTNKRKDLNRVGMDIGKFMLLGERDKVVRTCVNFLSHIF